MRQELRLYIIFLTTLLGAVLVLSGCPGSHSSSPPAPVSKPGFPIGLSAVSGNGSVTVTWSAVSSATSYHVFRSLSSGATGTIIASPTSTSYQDSGLTNGTTYYYSVSALNSAGESAVSFEVSATPAPPSGSITISGKVLYEDKEYGANGFTGTRTYKAVRYATVEIVDSTGPAITSSITGTDGSFVISLPTPTNPSLYARVLSEAVLSGVLPQVEVKDLSNSPYAVGSPDFAPAGDVTVDISIPSTTVGGAFNILDVYTSGVQFVYSLAGAYPSVSLSAFWQKGNTRGTYYCQAGYIDQSNCPDGEGIYVLNSTTDTDEYDDDVLYHEFGHFTAAHFSDDNSQGGAHALTDNDLDMRLSWSEGWGDSFPGAVKLWLFADPSRQNLLSSALGLPLTEYVDTNSRGAGLAIDMGSPDGTYGSLYDYACGEVAVAKILLDASKKFGMQTVWDVISDFKTNPTVSTNPVNLELFWDRWHLLSEPTTTASGSVTLDSIFQNRKIYYSTTSNQVSTSTYTVNISGPKEYRITGSGNIDYVAFDTIQDYSYTLGTSNLRNGADTFIGLYSSSDLVNAIATNDNAVGAGPANPNGTIFTGSTVPSDVYPSLCDSWGICHDNGSDILRSSLTFTAATTGTYYAKIQSSASRPVSAGRYGTYSLSITTSP